MRWTSLLGLFATLAFGSSYWGLSGSQAETQFVRLLLWGATLICCLAGVGLREGERNSRLTSWVVALALILSACAAIALIDEVLFLLLILDYPNYSHRWLVLRLGTSLPYVAAAAAIGLRIAEGSKTKLP